MPQVQLFIYFNKVYAQIFAIRRLYFKSKYPNRVKFDLLQLYLPFSLFFIKPFCMMINLHSILMLQEVVRFIYEEVLFINCIFILTF